MAEAPALQLGHQKLRTSHDAKLHRRHLVREVRQVGYIRQQY